MAGQILEIQTQTDNFLTLESVLKQYLLHNYLNLDVTNSYFTIIGEQALHLSDGITCLVFQTYRNKAINLSLGGCNAMFYLNSKGLAGSCELRVNYETMEGRYNDTYIPKLSITKKFYQHTSSVRGDMSSLNLIMEMISAITCMCQFEIVFKSQRYALRDSCHISNIIKLK